MAPAATSLAPKNKAPGPAAEHQSRFFGNAPKAIRGNKDQHWSELRNRVSKQNLDAGSALWLAQAGCMTWWIPA